MNQFFISALSQTSRETNSPAWPALIYYSKEVEIKWHIFQYNKIKTMVITLEKR